MKSRAALLVGLVSALGLAACAYGASPESDGTSKADPKAGDVTGDAAPYESSNATDQDDAGGATADSGTTRDAAPVSDGGAAKADTGTPGTPTSTTPTTPAPTPQFGAGELAVTEVLYNPSGSEPDEEWFEVTNRATASRSLNGLVLADGSGNSYTIPATPALVVPAQGYVVLARNKAVAVLAGVPSAMIVHEYSLLTLANGSTGGLTVKKGTTTLASVPFGQWTSALNGESIQLKNMASPTTASSWCFSATSWSSGADFGTPGTQADCP